MRLLSKLCSLAFFLSSTFAAFSQVAIGTGATAPNPDTNAVLLLEGNGSQGIIIPKVSSLGTFGKPGMIVYNTTTGSVHYFNTAWVQVGSGTGGTQGIQIVGNKVLIGTGAGFSTEFSIANTAPTIQGQILMWDTSLNSGAGGWTSSANTAPSTIGQVLKWNGSRWEPGTDLTGTVTTLSGDVSGATTSTTISPTAGNSIATALNNGATTSRILESRITPSGTNNQVLTTVGGVTQWANPTGGALPSLSANQLLSNNGANTAITVAGDVGLSVTGTTGTFTIANNAVTDAKVATGISANKITTGTLPVAQVPNLDAAKITTGTLSTARLDVGTTSNKIVQLDGAGKLPAIDGSQLTNLPAGSETDPTVKAINGLVKSNGTIISAATAGTDYLTPTGNGSGLTNLNATNISTGTLAIANGGTGSTTAPLARTALGLGTLATLSSVTTTEITDGTITDVDVSGTAAIAGSKIVPAFGAQNITTTTGSGSIGGGLNVGLANQFSINNAGNITKINGATTSFPAANAAGVLTNDGTGTLTWASGSGWGLTGNAGTLPAINFIGTTDAQDLVFRTNNTEFARLTSAGKLGIGTNAPNGFLDVQNAGASGNAAIFNVSNASNNGAAVFANKNGTTGAAFQALVAGGAEGLNINQNGTGFGLDVIVSNVSSNNSAIIATHNGNGNVIVANATGTGSAATLSITNAASPATALSVTTVGTGSAATFTGGNVGIGTTTPASKLDVGGDVRLSQTTAPSTTTDKLYNVGGSLFWNGTNISSGGIGWGLTGNTLAGTERIGSDNAQPLVLETNNTERMRINPTGIVGIGTTSFGGNSMLYVNGGVQVDAGDNNTGTSTHGLTFGSNNSGEVIASQKQPGGPNQNGLDFYTGFVNRMAITPSGNVGLGTTSPVSKLDVAGDVRLAQITAPSTITDKLYNVAGSLFWNGTNISSGGSGWGLTGNAGTTPASQFIGTTDGQDFSIRTNNLERLTVTSAGLVGIGSNAPTAALGVLKGTGLATASFAGTTHISHFNFSGPEDTNIRGGLTGSKVYLNDTHNGDVILAAGGGNVGIGTTTASAKLDVLGGVIKVGTTITGPGSQSLSQMDDPINGLLGGGGFAGHFAGDHYIRGVWGLKFDRYNLGEVNPSSGNYFGGNPDAGSANFRYWTGSTWRSDMVIRGSGNVGIANTNPTEKLDITGNLKFSGALMPNNLPGTAGQVLTSAGPGAAPTWAPASGGGNMFTTNNLSDLTNFATARANLGLGSVAYTWPASNGTGVLTNNGSGTLTWSPGGAGSVTTVSVTPANGFTGSVATASSTPAITIGTSLTGVLKGNGTALSVATGADLPVMTATVGGAVPTPPNNTTTFLRGDGTFATPAGGGTVTNTSVVSANGFSGTVATSTSTPAITIGTSLTGLLKGNGTGLAIATAGTDYIATETDPTVKAITGLVKSNGTTISAATAGTDYLMPTGNGSGLTNLNATNISAGTLPTTRLDVGTGANQLVQLDATGKLPAVDGSQLTGLAGGGDITGVTAGTGLTGGAASGNATLNVDVGTTANKIVQLDATGKLPAIDGSQLTGLAGGGDITGVTAGTGLTGGAASGNATLNVDVGTTANKIVQLDATGKLPVIDGSQLTNLPAGAESDPTVKAINGLVKSNGTTVSAATAGTDYLTPTGSAAGLTGITAAQIPNLDAAKITTGTLSTARLDVGTTANKIVQLDATGKLPVIDGSQLTNLPAGAETDPTVKAINGLVKSNGTTVSAATAGTDYLTPTGSAAGLTGLLAAQIPALDASKITTGSFTVAQIPNLDASKITTGALPIANGGTGATTAPLARTALGLGTLSTLSSVTSAEITDGTIANIDIANVDAAKITTGTLSTARIDVGTTANKIVQLDATGKLPAVDGSLLTNLAGGGDITGVTAGTGLTGGAASGNATLNVDVGTTANKIVQLDATGKLPAVDGSLLTNLAGGGDITGVTAGTGLTGGAASGNATLNVDVGTTANKIVQLDATGKLPVIDGSQLTNLPAGVETDPTVKAINGLIKSNGTTISAATAGTDYLTPTGSAAGLTGLLPAQIPSLDASKITTGAFPVAQIPNLDASKITTGTLPIANGGTGATTAPLARTALGLGTLATLSALTSAEITDGTIANIDIANVDAAKITTGTLSTARIDVGTTANKIVQLDATGKLPAIDGSLLTNLPAGVETDPTVKAINGLVKSNGTTISAATAGTDYLTPTGSAAGLTGFPTLNQNTTGNAATATTLATGRTIALTGDVTYTSPVFNGSGNVTAAATVTRINGTSLAGLATGILKNTTATGVPSIATGADLPVMTATVGGAVPTPPNNTTTFLRGDGIFAAPAGGGTVTTVSIASANGFNGTVATPTTTPALTIGTSLTGILKGNGTGIAVATAGTDYIVTETDPAVKAITGLVKSNGTTISAATAGTDYLTPTGSAAGLTGLLPAQIPSLDASKITTGTLLIANGGTGATTAPLARTALGLGTLATLSAVTTTEITDGTIADADISGSAAIAGTKVIPNFGAQNISTTGTLTTGTTGQFAVNATGNITKINNVTTSFPAANAAGVLTNNGTGTLTWAAASSGWGLTGNATTVDGTNFIGTTDNIPFSIRVNNQKAGRIDHLLFNSFFGYQAGNNSTGANNVALGYTALQTNTTGQGNAALGSSSLFANSTGNANTAVGYNTLTANTASFNTAIGNVALQANTSGFNNTAAGYQSLILNSTASGNTAFGSTTLNLNTTGANNTALGFSALGANATGSNNTAVGALANVSTGALTNATAIGANSSVTASNTIQLGDAAVTTVNVGTGTTAKLVAGQLQITGGTLGAGRVLTSDASGNATWQPATGGSALINNTGTRNLFAGSTVPTVGADNAIFGELAGNSNTGSYNVIMGSTAAFPKTTGDLNVIIGWNAGRNGTFQQGNTYVGAESGNSSGASTLATLNSFFGERSGYKNTTGAGNTFIGDRAGAVFPDAGTFGNTTGSDNTAVGDFATMEFGGLANATALGSRAMVSASNSLVLGSINGVNGATASTNVGIGTTTPTSTLQVNGGQVVLNSTASYGFQQNYLSKSIATYIDANGGWLGTRTNDNLNFFTNNGLPQMTIIPSGNVGIGTTAPAVPLDIVTSIGFSTGTSIYFNSNTPNLGPFYQGPNGGGNVSVRASGAFLSTGNSNNGGFYVTSDERIKRKVGISDSRNDLATLMKLKVTDYKYVDSLNVGNVKVKGVFAQEVEKIYPQAISKQTNWIPNIYALAKEVAFDDAKQTLSVTMVQPHNLLVGDKVKLISSTSGEKPSVVASVDGNTFTVSNWTEKSEKVFVFGKEVNDFRIVDYDRLFTLNLSATQELVKMLDEQKKMIDELKAKEEESKKKIAVLEASLSKVAAGETELTNLKSEIEKIKAALGLSVEATAKKAEEKTEVKKEK